MRARKQVGARPSPRVIGAGAVIVLASAAAFAGYRSHATTTRAMAAAPASPIVDGATAPARDMRRARQAMAELVLDRWAPEAARRHATPQDDWKRAMRASVGRLAMPQLQAALAADRLDTMLAIVDGPVVDGLAVDRAATAGDARGKAAVPGKALAALGAYNALAPCRLVDTRNVGTRIAARGVLAIKVSGSDMSAQGGAATDCGVPANAGGVVVNITVVSPDIAGYLTAYPYATYPPLASSLNYVAGAIASNEVIVPRALGQAADISLFTHAATDVVVDVVGYYATPPRYTLSCTNVVEVFSLPTGNYTGVSAVCPFNQSLFRYSAPVGGRCRWLGLPPGATPPGTLSGAIYGGYRFACEGGNLSGQTQQIETTAVCCDVVYR